MGSKDYTRVCESCGVAWLLPKEWAEEKAPRASQVKSMQRATRFAIGRQRERYSMQAAALQSSQDHVLSNTRCPSCGSTSYKQYKPGKAPESLVVTPRGGPSAAQPTTSTAADELAKLMQLHEAGGLTDDEFAAMKAKLIDG